MELRIEESSNDNNVYTNDYISIELNEKISGEEDKSNEYMQNLYKDTLNVLFNPLLLFV